MPICRHSLQAMNGSDVVPFARAPWNDEVAIKRILDHRRDGCARTPTSIRARKLKPPLLPANTHRRGIRGVAGSPRAAGYTGNAMPYLQSANAETIVMVAVETMEAVQNLDEILLVEDLDGIFIRTHGPREQYGAPR